MKIYTIPVIGGDGIGPEVIAEGKKVLSAAAQAHGFGIEWHDLPHGADHYLKTGELLSIETLVQLSRYRAIYLGAVGDSRVAPGILEKGIVIALRNYFDQFVNVRPIRFLEGVRGPVSIRAGSLVDFVVVRENTEDFYVSLGGRVTRGRSRTQLCLHRSLYECIFSFEIESGSELLAYQIGIATREGVQRVLRFAFDLARTRRCRLSLVDKANVLTEMYGLWREEFEELGRMYVDVQKDCLYVDAAAALLLQSPDKFDVIVTPNLFGDILSDEASAICGGLGLAPGANLNPSGTSMFEPVHGSAPPLKGTGRANPVAAIWAGALMLSFLGERAAGEAVLRAIDECLREQRVRTPDLSGSNRTTEVGDEIASIVSARQ